MILRRAALGHFSLLAESEALGPRSSRCGLYCRRSFTARRPQARVAVSDRGTIASRIIDAPLLAHFHPRSSNACFQPIART